jgi:hypothetical protein
VAVEALALAAATAVVSALATDSWQQVRDAVVRLWRRARPDHAAAVESDLGDTRSELTAIRDAGDSSAEEGLVADWQRRLRRLLAADPALETELQRILDQEITPLLSAAEQERVRIVQNVTASAPGALAQGVMFGNIINHRNAASPPT